MIINQTTIKFAGLIILAVIVLWVLWTRDLFEKGPETGKDIPPPGGCRGGFDAVNETVAIHDTLDEWDYYNDRKVEGFTRILNLNDCELAKIHNEYRKRYGKTSYPTLRKLVQAENIFWGIGYSSTLELKNQVLNRLAELGI